MRKRERTNERGFAAKTERSAKPGRFARTSSPTRGAGRREDGRAPGYAKADSRQSRVRASAPNKSVEPEITADRTSTDYVTGRHPVLEALKSGRSINKILVSESSEGGSLSEILGKAKSLGVVVQRVPKANLTKIAGENHQGILAYIAPRDYAELDDIAARQTGHPPLVVLLDEVEDPHNLGAVIRTAEATGVQGVVIPKRRAVPLTGVVAKAAAGALEYVPVARVTNLVSAIEQLKKAGYWVVGTEIEGAASYTEVDYRGPVAIVIGSEGKGLSRLVKEHCDYLVRLPMLGNVQSLNASVATGVLLYEVVRQRQ